MGEMEDWARLLGGIGSGFRVSLADVHIMEDKGGADSTSSGVLTSRDKERRRWAEARMLRPTGAGGRGGRGRPLVDSVGHRRLGGVCGGTGGRPV
jgi:hypothetical protein